MVDANMAWSVSTAIRAAKGLSKHNVLWLEVRGTDFTVLAFSEESMIIQVNEMSRPRG